MQGGYLGHVVPAREGEVHVVNVEVDYVKFIGGLKNLLQHQYVVGQLVYTFLVEAQRARAARYQLCRCDRVATGEEGNIVTLLHQLLRSGTKRRVPYPHIVWEAHFHKVVIPAQFSLCPSFPPHAAVLHECIPQN